MTVNVEEAQSYLDSGYYAYPVKTVYSTDGNEVIIAAGEYNAYIANGYLKEKPIIAVEGGESGNDSGSIDYSEHAGKTEEELAILTAALTINQHYSIPKQAVVSCVYAGYYEGQFLVVDSSTMVMNVNVSGSVISRLEKNYATTFLGQQLSKPGEIFSKPTYPWAKELIETKTEHFTRYNSKQFKEAVIALLKNK